MHSRAIKPGILAALAALGLYAASRAAPPDAHPTLLAAGDPVPAAQHAPSRKYVGDDNCSLCHDKENPRFKTDLVRLNEYSIWEQADPHHLKAFQAIESAAAANIEQRLGWPAGAAKDPARGCIACHAVDCRAAPCDARFRVSQGVSCEACHGPASEWIDRHWHNEWRELNPEVKEQKYGMVNVRDPAREAQLCVSCHVGAADEGKFVTHTMFMAGHPPLPSFELETFARRMPPHWRSLDEKSPELQRQLHYQPTPLPHSRRVAIGALVTLRAAIGRVAVPAGPPHAAVPLDFAALDCTACHHELRRPSTRQSRGYGVGPPGRPPLPSWPLAIARLAWPAGESGLRTDELLHVQGYELRVDLAATARIHTTDELIQKKLAALEAEPLDQNRVLDLARQLCHDGATQPPDYDSARQIHWALAVMLHELRAVAPAGWPLNRAPARAEIDAILAAISDDLDPQPEPAAGPPTADSLSVSLLKMNRFDPAAFQRRLARLAELLSNGR